MFNKKFLVFYLIIFFIFNTSSNSLENKILIKIENQIITSLDINNELKYLVALNPNLKNLKKNDIIQLSKRSILQEKIKKIEIEKNTKFLKLYLLSEIFFEVSNLKELDIKFQEISEAINKKGFDFAALKYSMSSTSNLGGKLDWINENSLNKKIRAEIKNLKINDFTKPINVPGGFLILQINDIKSTEVKIDVEKELKKLENYEKNNLLNQYSKIYFNKVKKDLEINEL